MNNEPRQMIDRQRGRRPLAPDLHAADEWRRRHRATRDQALDLDAIHIAPLLETEFKLPFIGEVLIAPGQSAAGWIWSAPEERLEAGRKPVAPEPSDFG
jgi:hypothetical protein